MRPHRHATRVFYVIVFVKHHEAAATEKQPFVMRNNYRMLVGFVERLEVKRA